MEGALTILLFFGIMAVTAMVFGVWAIASIFRLIGRGIGSLFAPAPPPTFSRGRLCSNPQCHADNPGNARFCRRCGNRLPQSQQVNVRRAAMW